MCDPPPAGEHAAVDEALELVTDEAGQRLREALIDGGIERALSPLLGNIYLHHVLDLWFEQEVCPRLRGQAQVIRYADDFVIVFELEADARRVMGVLGKRMERFGLVLHPEKTRLLPVRRPDGPTGGKGPATFDFLGFTV